MATMAAILKICIEPSLGLKGRLTQNVSGNHMSDKGHRGPLVYRLHQAKVTSAQSDVVFVVCMQKTLHP